MGASMRVAAAAVFIMKFSISLEFVVVKLKFVRVDLFVIYKKKL